MLVMNRKRVFWVPMRSVVLVKPMSVQMHLFLGILHIFTLALKSYRPSGSGFCKTAENFLKAQVHF